FTMPFTRLNLEALRDARILVTTNLSNKVVGNFEVTVMRLGPCCLQKCEVPLEVHEQGYDVVRRTIGPFRFAGPLCNKLVRVEKVPVTRRSDIELQIVCHDTLKQRIHREADREQGCREYPLPHP